MVNTSDTPTPTGFLASLPLTPYYAVVFAAIQRPGNDPAYLTTALRMVELAERQPGFLGMESAADNEGHELTVSYWRSLDDIRVWREHAEHRLAQEQGRSNWYLDYVIRVCRVEYDYSRQIRRPVPVHQSSAASEDQLGPATATFESLARSRQAWLWTTLRPWCQQASRAELVKAEHEWHDLAGRVDPVKTLWAWAWGRFPELVHEDLGLDESAAVEIRLKDGQLARGYPDARRSSQGRLTLVMMVDGRSEDQGPFSIDEIATVVRVRE